MVAEYADGEDISLLNINCPVLVTERLVLRPPHNDDIPDIAALANNRLVAEMLARMPHPYTEADASAFVLQSYARIKNDYQCAVTLADSGTFIGCAGLHHSSHGIALGYWIGEPYWGKGYATEAAQSLVDLAFRATLIDYLHVNCRIINEASRRVIQKCGFQYVGEEMIHSDVAGMVPVANYRLDRRTWMSLRNWGARP